jgi:hypothetical protein
VTFTLPVSDDQTAHISLVILFLIYHLQTKVKVAYGVRMNKTKIECVYLQRQEILTEIKIE